MKDRFAARVGLLRSVRRWLLWGAASAIILVPSAWASTTGPAGDTNYNWESHTYPGFMLTIATVGTGRVNPQIYCYQHNPNFNPVPFWDYISSLVPLHHNGFSFSRTVTVIEATASQTLRLRAKVIVNGHFTAGEFTGNVSLGGTPCHAAAYHTHYAGINHLG